MSTYLPFQRLFNFAVLQRYRWRAQDFMDMQDNGLVEMIRGIAGGLMNGSVIKGLDIASVTGLNFTLNPGIAIGPSGNLMILNQQATGTFLSPSGSIGSRNLVVIQPLLQTPASGIIVPPTMPLTTAPLFVDQYAQIHVYDGQAYNGAYPPTGSNDVILFGVRLAQSATSFTASGAIYQDRDMPGRRNSTLGGYAERNVQIFDDRCRCYNAGAPLVGIKPSQAKPPHIATLTYITASVASLFPRSGGSYNGDAGDTFINFSTGVISGADTTSGSFVATVPSAGQFVWALVTLSGSDTLSVQYGTAGTYLQCRTGLKNQSTVGPGGIPTSTGFKLAYILIGSSNGSTVTEVDVYDARSLIPASSSLGTLMQSGIVWVPDNGAAGPAATEILEFNQDALSFVQSDGDNAFCSVQVPLNYTPGTQITLYGVFYSPSTTNAFSFKTTTNLIRNGTDAVGSTTNTHTSATASVNNSSPANLAHRLSFDLTDGGGNINGVAVSPGDTLEINLLRPVDTDTNNVRFRPSSTEVTFS